jgi:CheY-like chemotaxis protein
LESFGYQVTTATSGEEALRLYLEKQSDVDLIILDLGMPGMGGKKCLDELLKIDPGVKVIIASGYSAQGLVAETLAAGALEFISKPYRLAQMLEKIRIVLDS